MNSQTNPTDWYSDDAATFGDRMAAAREVTGLSQRDLAARLGVKDKTIKAWENDTSEPRANKLQLLAGVLNVSMRWMLTGEGEGVSAPEDEVELSSDVSALLAEMRELRGQAGTLADRIGRAGKAAAGSAEKRPSVIEASADRPEAPEDAFLAARHQGDGSYPRPLCGCPRGRIVRS